MGQGEAKFNDTEYARQNALLETNIHASNAMRTAEEINAQRDHCREVETSARKADQAGSHEVASLSFRVEELMRHMRKAQSQQTQALLQQNDLVSAKVRESEAEAG